MNVLTLALGLVTFVAAYAVVAYWGNSDRHFANTDRTFVITANLALRDGSINTGTFPQTTDFYQRYLRLEFPEFETLARARIWNRQASVSADGRRALVVGLAVDPEFLDIFDLPFLAGDPRTALQSPNSLVLTDTAALRLFGTKDALGKTVSLGGNLIDATVTGVLGEIPEPSHIGSSQSAPLHFEIMAPYELYERLAVAVNRPQTPPAGANANGASTGAGAAAAPAAASDAAAPAAAETPADAPPPAQNENWLGGYCCTTYAMLKRGSGVSAASLNARLRDFAERRMTPEQLKMATIDVGAVPLSGLLVTGLNAQLLGGASGWLSITTILFGLGALVLLVACMNYANLSTARAARRAREIGLRKVLGARRLQLVVQYLLEAGVLTAAALAVAVGVVALIAPLVDNAVGIDMRAAIDTRFWLFIGALLVGVTVLGGAYPALVLSRVRPIEALRLGRIRIGPRFAATLLVGAQFAAASFLLIAVIVMYSQSAALVRTGAGSTRDQHLVISNFRPVTGVDGDLLRSELERLPQVKGVTAMGSAPWSDNVNLNLFSRSPEETTSLQTAFQNNVAYDFFATLDIPVIAGRVFDREHNDLSPQGAPDPNRPPTNLVIDRILAQQLGFRSPEEAVDQTIYFPAVLGEQAATIPCHRRGRKPPARAARFRSDVERVFAKGGHRHAEHHRAPVRRRHRGRRGGSGSRLAPAVSAGAVPAPLHGRAVRRELRDLRSRESRIRRARCVRVPDLGDRPVRHGHPGRGAPQARDRRPQIRRRSQNADRADVASRLLEARDHREPDRVASSAMWRRRLTSACSSSESA